MRQGGTAVMLAVGVLMGATSASTGSVAQEQETLQTAGRLVVSPQQGGSMVLVDPATGDTESIEAETGDGDPHPPIWVGATTIRRIQNDWTDANQNRIVEIDLATGAARTVWTPPELMGATTLSPDGARATVWSYEDGILAWDLATDDRRLVLEKQDETRFDFGWSDDGRKLAAVTKGQDRWDLTVVDVETGERHTIDVGDLNPRSPRFSPDGRQIAFLHAVPTKDHMGREAGHIAGRWDVWVVDVDGAHLQHAHGPSIENDSEGGDVAQVIQAPSWAPDGRSLAALYRDGKVTVTELDTGVSRSHNLGTLVGGEFDRRQALTWSPDGRWLAAGILEFENACQCHVPYVAVLDVARLDAEPTFSSYEDAPMGPAFAPGVTRRFDGRDRIDTAIRVSRHVFDEATDAVLARADLYPDALTGGPLAAQVGGPVLLTATSGLADHVADELVRLGVERVHLLGSQAALSAQVARDLRALGIEVRRYSGGSRFHTAWLVAHEIEDVSTVYVVEGQHGQPRRGWPDAVSASGLASAGRHPIMLVRRDEVPGDTADWLLNHQDEIERVVVIGGDAAVADETARGVASLARARLERIAGPTRYDTSARVAAEAIQGGADQRVGWLATGENWPDALVAGPAAAGMGGYLALARPDDLPEDAPVRSLWGAPDTSVRIHLSGGRDVLSPVVETAINRHFLADR